MPQRIERINTRGAHRGNEGSQQCGEREQQGGRGERYGVSRRNTVNARGGEPDRCRDRTIRFPDERTRVDDRVNEMTAYWCGWCLGLLLQVISSPV